MRDETTAAVAQRDRSHYDSSACPDAC